MIKILEIFDPLAIGISVMGMVIMVWGIAVCLIRFLRSEWDFVKSLQSIHNRENIRVQLGTYLLLGLEFLIAGRYSSLGTSSGTRIALCTAIDCGYTNGDQLLSQ